MQSLQSDKSVTVKCHTEVQTHLISLSLNKQTRDKHNFRYSYIKSIHNYFSCIDCSGIWCNFYERPLPTYGKWQDSLLTVSQECNEGGAEITVLK